MSEQIADPLTNKFYYKGKFFQDENGFFRYVKEWPKTPLTEESLEEMLNMLKKDILCNIQYGIEIKNGDMNNLLEKTFLEAMMLRNKK